MVVYPPVFFFLCKYRLISCIVLYWCVFTSKYIGTENMITEFFKESKVFTAEIIVNDKLTFTRWTWQSLSATNSQIQKRDYFSNLKLRVKNHHNG